MKKHYFLGIMIISLVLTGCGKEPETYYPGETLVRSIDDLYVHEKPLVKRMNAYNDNGGELKLSGYILYEYDEKNRYKTVYYYNKNAQTKEMEYTYREEYEYDDYFCYVTGMYPQHNNLKAQHIYDLHGNAILDEIPADWDYSDTETVFHTYKYSVDTDEMQEEYCYEGEGVDFSHHKISYYNQQGDEIYEMYMYGKNSIKTTSTDYEYDAEGRKLSETRTCCWNDRSGKEDYSVTTSYTYDAIGRLITEKCVSSGMFNRSKDQTTICAYEYD